MLSMLLRTPMIIPGARGPRVGARRAMSQAHTCTRRGDAGPWRKQSILPCLACLPHHLGSLGVGASAGVPRQVCPLYPVFAVGPPSLHNPLRAALASLQHTTSTMALLVAAYGAVLLALILALGAASAQQTAAGKRSSTQQRATRSDTTAAETESRSACLACCGAFSAGLELIAPRARALSCCTVSLRRADCKAGQFFEPAVAVRVRGALASVCKRPAGNQSAGTSQTCRSTRRSVLVGQTGTETPPPHALHLHTRTQACRTCPDGRVSAQDGASNCTACPLGLTHSEDRCGHTSQLLWSAPGRRSHQLQQSLLFKLPSAGPFAWPAPPTLWAPSPACHRACAAVHASSAPTR